MPQYDKQKVAELRAEREKKAEQRQEISVKMHENHESDEWTGEGGPSKLIQYKADGERHALLDREIDAIDREIAAQEGLKPKVKSPADNFEKFQKESMRKWCMGGAKMLDEEEQGYFITEVTSEMVKENPLLGAGGELFNTTPQMAVTDPTRSDIDTGDSAAGLAAPEEWRDGLVERLKYFGSVASNCHNFSTDNGNDMHVNQMDSTGQEGAGIADQSQTGGTGIPGDAVPLDDVTDIVFKAYWRHSNFMPVRLEAFTDLQFDAAGRVQREAMRRMGRGWNNWFTVGNGTNKPHGIVASAKVIDGGAGSAYDGSGGVDYDNLLSMEYGIDLGYLAGDEGGEGAFMDENGGMIGWMMNRRVEQGLRGAVDADSRPLWTPNLESGRAIQGKAAMLNGWPYTINQHMADGTTANDLPLLFGACGHYAVRNIGGMMFYRFFDSNTVTKMSVQFIGMSRRDGRSLGPTVSSKNDAYAVLQVKA